MYLKDLLFSLILGYLIVLIVLFTAPAFGQAIFEGIYDDTPMNIFTEYATSEKTRYGYALGGNQDTYIDDSVYETLTTNNYRRRGEGKIEHTWMLYLETGTDPVSEIMINAWAEKEGIFTFYYSFDDNDYFKIGRVDHTYDGVYYIEQLPSYYQYTCGILYIKVIGEMPIKEGLSYNRKGKRQKSSVFEDYSLFVDEIVVNRYDYIEVPTSE
jgi:hypothetical protein